MPCQDPAIAQSSAQPWTGASRVPVAVGHLAGREAASQSEPLPSRPDVADPACAPSLLCPALPFQLLHGPRQFKTQPKNHKPPTPRLSLGGFPPNLDGPKHALSLARHLSSATTNHHPVLCRPTQKQESPCRAAAPRVPHLPLPLLRRDVRYDLRFSARPQPGREAGLPTRDTKHTPNPNHNPMALA